MRSSRDDQENLIRFKKHSKVKSHSTGQLLTLKTKKTSQRHWNYYYYYYYCYYEQESVYMREESLNDNDKVKSEQESYTLYLIQKRGQKSWVNMLLSCIRRKEEDHLLPLSRDQESHITFIVRICTLRHTKTITRIFIARSSSSTCTTTLSTKECQALTQVLTVYLEYQWPREESFKRWCLCTKILKHIIFRDDLEAWEVPWTKLMIASLINPIDSECRGFPSKSLASWLTRRKEVKW